MSQSVFDPTGPFTERSGSTFLGPHVQDHSQMPPDIVDGEVSEEEAAELEEMANCKPCPGLPGLIAPFDTSPPDPSNERDNIELPGTL
jgi:hypothetical protein